MPSRSPGELKTLEIVSRCWTVLGTRFHHRARAMSRPWRQCTQIVSFGPFFFLFFPRAPDNDIASPSRSGCLASDPANIVPMIDAHKQQNRACPMWTIVRKWNAWAFAMTNVKHWFTRTHKSPDWTAPMSTGPRATEQRNSS